MWTLKRPLLLESYGKIKTSISFSAWKWKMQTSNKRSLFDRSKERNITWNLLTYNETAGETKSILQQCGIVSNTGKKNFFTSRLCQNLSGDIQTNTEDTQWYNRGEKTEDLWGRGLISDILKTFTRKWPKKIIKTWNEKEWESLLLNNRTITILHVKYYKNTTTCTRFNYFSGISSTI